MTTAVLLHGRLAVAPIYDSISLPPAPYRYESPPASARNGNQQPSGVEATEQVQNGFVLTGSLATDDNQVSMFWGTGAFRVSQATRVSCQIEPVANPPSPPAGMEIRGNVYSIRCVTPLQERVTTASAFELTLRLPPGQTNEISYYDGRTWHKLVTTFAPSGDPYAGVKAPGFGLYAAMARLGAPTTDSFLKIITPYLELFGILFFVVVFAIIALVQELRRRRRLHRAQST